MNPKKEVERRCAQAADAYRRGTAARWVACLAASRVVGAYDRGATVALARQLAISVSQVENLARAGLTYRQLRGSALDLPSLRRALTPSHFSAIGDSMRKYDLTTVEALGILREAAEYGASVASMRGYLEGEYGDRGVVPVDDTWRADLIDHLRRLVSDPGIPGDVRGMLSGWLGKLEGDYLAVGGGVGGRSAAGGG